VGSVIYDQHNLVNKGNDPIKAFPHDSGEGVAFGSFSILEKRISGTGAQILSFCRGATDEGCYLDENCTKNVN